MEQIQYPQGLRHLEVGLEKGESRKKQSFLDFMRNTYSLSMPDFDFNWHHEVLCNDVEKAMNEGYFYGAELPRYHSKSTTLGYGLCTWLMDEYKPCDILYLSYKEGMSRWHLAEMKANIYSNPELNLRYKDLRKDSDWIIRYDIDGFRSRVIPAGVFAFERGIHTRFVICDDILSDPDNPLTLTQLKKVETRFYRIIMNIPTVNGFLLVTGTPMSRGDLFHQLREKEGFLYRRMPVYDPLETNQDLIPIYGDKGVLWESKYNRDWLEWRRRNTGNKSFSIEFLLTPVMETEAYITLNELEPVLDSSLKNYSIGSVTDFNETFAGMDIGKKRHPSHISIYKYDDGEMIQVHQVFLDQVPYTEQVGYMNQLVESFNIVRGYYDNTRGELDERSLRSEWKPIVFSHKNQATFAQAFERRILAKKIKLIDNSRQINQIIIVDNTFKAPETAEGHGDAFFSNILAVAACEDFYPFDKAKTSLIVGDIADIYKSKEMKYNILDEESQEQEQQAKQKLISIMTPQKQRKLECSKCGKKEGLVFSNKSGNCRPEEAETKLCLICGYKEVII